MYLTFINSIIEILIDVGPIGWNRGFYFAISVLNVKVITIDTYYREAAIALIAIVIMKGARKWIGQRL